MPKFPFKNFFRDNKPVATAWLLVFLVAVSLPIGASIANQYDVMGRLTNTALVNYWRHPLDGYGYVLDVLGLRTNITRDLGLATNIVRAQYDKAAQIISWAGAETNGRARLNEQLGYAYDSANNLLYRTNNALLQTFTVDALNQLSNVTRSGTLTVSGALPAPASSVTVNGANAQTNADFTFASGGNTITNSGTNTFVIAANGFYGTNPVTETLNINLPATVSFQYDANGNLTNDGTRWFFHDSANRLTSATEKKGSNHSMERF